MCVGGCVGMMGVWVRVKVTGGDGSEGYYLGGDV